MSVSLTMAPTRRASVSSADDPFKKYWIMILVGFGLLSVWIVLPMMEPAVGSTHVDASSAGAGAAASDQSLDATLNPGGAPGKALVSADDESKQQALEAANMFYQSVPDAGASAAGAPLTGAASVKTAATSASLAQQLKDAGKKDASGWGGEKAQRGFDSPKLSGALSGQGSAKGGSTASSPGTGAFGTNNANPTLTNGAGDLTGVGSARATSGAGYQSLHNAGQPGTMSGDKRQQKAPDLTEAFGGNSSTFDGALKHNGEAPNSGGKGGKSETLSALTAAPADLKVNPADLTKKNFSKPPTPQPAANSSSGGPGMGRDLMETAIPIVLGGMGLGMGGQLMGALLVKQMQHKDQEAQASNQQSQQNQSQLNKQAGQ